MAHSAVSGTPPPSGHVKQYVFVDEYNRHKRLKVMRACDGCRKRKIRCDGALQNGPWPCGACVRLKLKCTPPSLDQDEEPTTPDSATSTHSFTFQDAAWPTSTGVPPAKSQPLQFSQPNMVQEWASRLPPPSGSSAAPTSAPTLSPLDYDASTYSSNPYGPSAMPRLNTGAYSLEEELYGSPADSHSFLPQNQRPRQMPNLMRSETEASVSSGGDPQEIDAGLRELTEHMGEFRIEATSEAPYMAFQKKLLADTPAVEEEEAEVVLPKSVAADPIVRIPQEMMPDEAQAMTYFNYYFEYVHPYIPVLNKDQFFDQWRDDRRTISPLLLEGMFACVARFLEQPIVAKRWLTLAARHEESFKDVPRLSTLQAMILLTKARESLSKRGYYWRSWMAVKYMCTMSVDLGLHEHHEYHRIGNTCTLSRSDCMVRTRIWQTIFVLEMLVGAPMGRSDFAVEPDTVQFTLIPKTHDMNGFEYETSRRCTYLAQAVHNIKISNVLFQQNKRLKKDWALDPAFVTHNADLPDWLHALPIDMQLHYPDDGSAPYIGSDHFVAYLHAYHHLVVIMHHRPQLQALLERRDPTFKLHLDICLQSAMKMCRIQESLHRDFGFHGLQFMQRGINFTIYCVLTCTMLHLAAITSPEPVLNGQARQFFARHMRVLEHCLPYSSPEMQAQINALREAFSADTTQSFELKQTLGLRSPSMQSHPTPPSTNSGPVSNLPLFGSTTPTTWTTPSQPAADVKFDISRTMTPTSEDYASHHHFNSAALTSVPTTVGLPNGSGLPSSYPLNSYDLTPPPPAARSNNAYRPNGPDLALSGAAQPGFNEGSSPVWDPSGIFNSWNTAFGGAAAAQPQSTTPTPTYQVRAPTSPHAGEISLSQQQQRQQQQQQQQLEDALPAVTPVMWQDAFTSAFVSGHGQKRYREASVGDVSAAFGTSLHAGQGSQYTSMGAKRRG